MADRTRKSQDIVVFSIVRESRCGSAARMVFGNADSARPFVIMDWHTCSAVERTPGRVSGAWVFRGTRVPVRALFENLEEGASLDDFLEWFPGVTRTQAEAVLSHTAASLTVEAATG